MFGFSKSFVSVNGKRLSVSGQDISIVNDQIIVDGKVLDLDEYGKNTKVFNIVIEGDVQSVSGAFADIKVTGNVGSASSTSGDVTVDGDVTGSVNSVSGDVRVNGSISGNVSTVSGDIKH